jgi:hypothetical protein
MDFTADGRPIGIEITAPCAGTLEALNRILISLNQQPVTMDELAPLAAV